MGLDTSIFVYSPVSDASLFAAARSLIGAGEQYEAYRTPCLEVPWQPLAGHHMVTGQGLLGALSLLCDPEQALSGEDWPGGPYFAVLRLSSDYSHDLFVTGDVHAAFVEAIGAWLDERGAVWSWGPSDSEPVRATGAADLERLGSSVRGAPLLAMMSHASRVSRV